MANKDKNLKKLLSFMQDDLQKNGYTRYAVEQKSFDFSKKGIIRYSNSPKEKINNGSDFVNIKKRYKVFKNHNILKDTLYKAKEKSLITICSDYSVLADGMQNIVNGLSGLNISSSSQSTTERLEVGLTPEGVLWLENYQSQLGKLKQYLSKHIWAIFAIVISIIAILK